MRVMLLPDANVITRPAMRRTTRRVRSVGQSTDVPATGADIATNGNGNGGGGFWSWFGDTISPVIQTVTPGLIYDAAGIPVRTVTSGGQTTTVAGAPPAAPSSNRDMWLWIGVIGLSGVLVFSMMRRRGRARR